MAQIHRRSVRSNRSRSIRPLLAGIEPLENRRMMAVGLISQNRLGTDSGNGVSDFGTMSADGRYVVFESSASNLAADKVDHNGGDDIFVRDRATGKTSLVSVNRAGNESGNSFSSNPHISANGRYVVFQSFASDLAPNDTNLNAGDIFVRDLINNTTELVSVNELGGTTAAVSELSHEAHANGRVISDNGRFVVFESAADDLVEADGNGHKDVFVRDIFNHNTVLVSINVARDGGGDADSTNPVISANGRFIAWDSAATNLVPNLVDNNLVSDVFFFDFDFRETQLVSSDLTGNVGVAASDHPQMSADGQVIAFQSAANFVSSDTNGLPDIYYRDMRTPSARLVSVTPDGKAPNGVSEHYAISDDGRTVVFESRATNLIPNFVDGNGSAKRDIYARNMIGRSTYLVSAAATNAATGGNGESLHPQVNGNGQLVVFDSKATNLIPGFIQNNTATEPDVYQRNVSIRTIALVSARNGGNNKASGNHGSNFAQISRDGRYTTFNTNSTNLGPKDSNNTNTATGGARTDVYASPAQWNAPTPGVVIAETAGGTHVTEGGATDTYSISLRSRPAADVKINITPDDQITTSLSFINFTPLNWYAPQTITVTAVNDTVEEGTHGGLILHSASSADTRYDQVPVAKINVAITDNDPGITLTQTNGKTTVTEGGATDFYSIVLNSIPSADVIVYLFTDTQVNTNPISVTFTTTNWFVPRNIQVLAVDDAISEGTQQSTITHQVVSVDPKYNGFAIPNVVVTVTDNDVAASASPSSPLDSYFAALADQSLNTKSKSGSAS